MRPVLQSYKDQNDEHRTFLCLSCLPFISSRRDWITNESFQVNSFRKRFGFKAFQRTSKFSINELLFFVRCFDGCIQIGFFNKLHSWGSLFCLSASFLLREQLFCVSFKMIQHTTVWRNFCRKIIVAEECQGCESFLWEEKWRNFALDSAFLYEKKKNEHNVPQFRTVWFLFLIVKFVRVSWSTLSYQIRIKIGPIFNYKMNFEKWIRVNKIRGKNQAWFDTTWPTASPKLSICKM